MFQVEGFGFKVRVYGLRVTGLGFRVCALAFAGLRFQVELWNALSVGVSGWGSTGIPTWVVL